MKTKTGLRVLISDSEGILWDSFEVDNFDLTKNVVCNELSAEIIDALRMYAKQIKEDEEDGKR